MTTKTTTQAPSTWTSTARSAGAEAPTPRRRWSGLRAAAIAVFAVAVGVAGTVATPTSVGAYTHSGTGYYGTVNVAQTFGSYNNSAPSLVVGARAIGESKAYANRDQYVCVTTRLWIAVPTPNPYNRPYFRAMRDISQCGWIPASWTAATYKAITFPSDDIITARGYRTSYYVSWQLSNGQIIGKREVHLNTASDYQCRTANCTVNPYADGGVVIGFPTY